MTELTRRVVAGYLADLGGVWLAEEVTFRSPEDGTSAGGGRWQAAGWFARGSLASVDRPQLQLTRLLVESNYAAAEWLLTGRDRGSGGRITVPMAGFFDVSDGEIVQLDLFGNAIALQPSKIGLPADQPR